MKLRCILIATGSLAAAMPAQASLVTYTSQSAFDAAIGSETSFGFDEGNSSDHFHVASNSYAVSGITFADNENAANAIDGGSPFLFLVGSASNPVYGKDFLSFQNTDGDISADITAAGVTALGFEYASYILGGPATVAVNGGTPFVIDVSGAPSFIGFTSTTPITDVNVLFPTGFSFDLTSVSYGVASAAPEPATWAMMICGFGMAGGALRTRSRKVRPPSYQLR